jgi:hypothetical protein
MPVMAASKRDFLQKRGMDPTSFNLAGDTSRRFEKGKDLCVREKRCDTFGNALATTSSDKPMVYNSDPHSDAPMQRA